MFACSFFVEAQGSISEILSEFNTQSIPYITTDTLTTLTSKITFLDAREKTEFYVSHIKDAINVGYKDFDLKTTVSYLKDKKDLIVVYCSIGVRSEDIGEQLKAKGYTNVYNLFGGIFEWKNKGLPVYDINNEQTEKVHAYSKKWGKWLESGIKIYD